MKILKLKHSRSLVAAAVAAVVALSAWAVSGGMDDGEAAQPVPTVAVAAQTDADQGDEELAAPTAVTYEIYLSRDPFEPVVPAPDDSGNGGGGGGGGGTTPPEELCTESESEAVCEGLVVELVGIDPQTGDAIIRVGGAEYMVGVGDEFADRFRVLAIDAPCVTLLYGDESFTLCEGDRVLK